MTEQRSTEDLIRDWAEAYQGPSAEAVLLQMLPIGDQMSLELAQWRDRATRAEYRESSARSTIDRIDTALRGDGRSAMLVVTVQEIINDYRDKADG